MCTDGIMKEALVCWSVSDGEALSTALPLRVTLICETCSCSRVKRLAGRGGDWPGDLSTGEPRARRGKTMFIAVYAPARLKFGQSLCCGQVCVHMLGS